MSKYKLVGVVDRTISDTIHLTVEADGLGEACLTARRVLQKYPKPHEEDGVPFAYISHRDWGTPDLVTLEEEPEEGRA